MTLDEYRRSLLSHYAEFWGPCLYEARWRKGPEESVRPSFCVLVYPRTETQPQWVYATCGLHQPGYRTRIELHLLSPTEASDHIELLTALAAFCYSGYRINLGATVNFGRGWFPDSEVTHGMVSLPYLSGPSLENFSHQGRETKCYWLLPITKSERDFKKEHGIEALESLFESQTLDYCNPHRRPVA